MLTFVSLLYMFAVITVAKTFEMSISIPFSIMAAATLIAWAIYNKKNK